MFLKNIAQNGLETALTYCFTAILRFYPVNGYEDFSLKSLRMWGNKSPAPPDLCPKATLIKSRKPRFQRVLPYIHGVKWV